MRVGIDVGGTKIEAVAVNDDLEVLASFRRPVQPGPAGVTAGVIEAATAVSREAGVPVRSIGIGVPGAIRSGVVHHARNLSIESLDLERAVAEAIDADVRVANDVNAAAFGAWKLCGGTSRSFAYLNLGTGLAAGLVLDGRVWEGGRGMAGEIGYLSVDPAGPDHIDGLAGTLEGYASGAGVAGQWGVEGATAVDVFRAADAGDERAIAIREGVYFGAASAVRVLALTCGADAVVIGGGLTALGPALRDGMTKHFDDWATASPILSSLRLDRITQLLDDDRPINAIGAAIIGGQGG